MPENKGIYLVYLETDSISFGNKLYITAWFDGTFKEVCGKRKHIKTITKDEWQILAWSEIDFSKESIHSIVQSPFDYPADFDAVVFKLKNKYSNKIIYYTGYHSPLGWRISTIEKEKLEKYNKEDWLLDEWVKIEPIGKYGIWKKKIQNLAKSE